jgi:hypothetical protein
MHFYAKIDIMKARLRYIFLLYVETLDLDLDQGVGKSRYC